MNDKLQLALSNKCLEFTWTSRAPNKSNSLFISYHQFIRETKYWKVVKTRNYRPTHEWTQLHFRVFFKYFDWWILFTSQDQRRKTNKSRQRKPNCRKILKRNFGLARSTKLSTTIVFFPRQFDAIKRHYEDLWYQPPRKRICAYKSNGTSI